MTLVFFEASKKFKCDLTFFDVRDVLEFRTSKDVLLSLKLNLVYLNEPQ